MFKVISVERDKGITCHKVHYKSYLASDCWSYVSRHPEKKLFVVDKADQTCDISASTLKIPISGACIKFEIEHNRYGNAMRESGNCL